METEVFYSFAEYAGNSLILTEDENFSDIIKCNREEYNFLWGDNFEIKEEDKDVVKLIFEQSKKAGYSNIKKFVLKNPALFRKFQDDYLDDIGAL